MGQGSPDEGGQSPFVGERGCRQACNPANARTAGVDGVADLAATGGPSGLDSDVASLAAVDDEGQFEEGLFAPEPGDTRGRKLRSVRPAYLGHTGPARRPRRGPECASRPMQRAKEPRTGGRPGAKNRRAGVQPIGFS